MEEALLQLYDTIIIGAGVVGCSVARFLSRYQAKVLVLEREEDVCAGTSKANSGIVHAGFDAVPGSVMAKMNVKGCDMMRDLSEQLDFPYLNNGSLVLCFSEDDRLELRKLYERGIANGVKRMRILSGEEVRKMEPAVSQEVVEALWAPSAGIVCPFSLTIAMAENAADNGVEFRFLSKVELIEKTRNLFHVKMESGEVLQTKTIVNAAGLYADVFHNMVSENKLEIKPRRGEYILLDKTSGGLVTSTVFQIPTVYGKGVLVTPTIHGNVLVGPNAFDLTDKEDTETTRDGQKEVRSKAALSVPSIPFDKMITSFSGLRAHEKGGDFVLGEPDDCYGFFDATGIESPGLTSAPAIGEYLSGIISSRLRLPLREVFNERRKGITVVSKLSVEERRELIARKPEYGNIICRCEGISEGEIREAIHRTLGATSMDGIKRRVRQGMGRCQASFCTPKVLAILAEELGVSTTDIRKNRHGSELLFGKL